MAKLITVQFAVPDDDPAASMEGMRDELQEQLYDHCGIPGSFKIIGIAEYTNDPALFQDEPDA